LRYLFSVHAYLTEFDLAFKAFDSYVEIVQRGKDREDKSGELDYSLDNDDTVLHTASEAIRILCRYGAMKDAEKAREICAKVQEWLEVVASDLELVKSVDSLPVKVPVSPRVISGAYRALGICEAHWARLTFDAASRNGHQQQAVEYFRTALDPKYGNVNDLETKYALALLLAEMRELSPAIKIVKQALAHKPTKSDDTFNFSSNGYPSADVRSDYIDFSRERKLIPFWHLLSLLLTAKADLVTAVRSSNAAFEQFDDLTNLFGDEKEFRSEHLNEGKGKRPPRALIDKMEPYEKEGIIQVRITQIALMEALESPMEAIDATAELLALYARLFGDPKTEILNSHNRNIATAKPPKSSVGTLRHSILNRARSRRRNDNTMSGTGTPIPTLPSVASTRPSTMATSTTAAPTIQITNDDGTAQRGRTRDGNRHSLFRNKSQHSGHLTPRNSNRKLQKRSQSTSSRGSRRPESTTTVNETMYETINEKERTALDEHFSEKPQPLHESAKEQDEATQESVNEKRSLRELSDERKAMRNGYTDVETEDSRTVMSPPRPSTSHSDKKSIYKEPLDKQATSPKKTSFESKSVGSPQSIHKSPLNFPFSNEPSPPADRSHHSPTKSESRPSAPYPTTDSPTPEPVFPTSQERRHKISLLIELWLFIAELYIRGSVFDDAKGAVDEAAELVQVLEMEVSLESSSVKAFSSKGWGGGKSVEELWGDVYARVSSSWPRR
jgi:tetratricopeptide (TPR) repeat protein